MVIQLVMNRYVFAMLRRVLYTPERGGVGARYNLNYETFIRRSENMPVSFLPEYTAGCIVELQRELSSARLAPDERQRLTQKQQQLWDDAFPGKPYEEILAITRPFMLAA